MRQRVAQLTAAGRFELVEGSIADPAPGEVQVRVERVGICGSDLHSYVHGAVGDTPCVYPMVLGHEPAGVVSKVGAGVTGWSPGDRAAFEPAIYCYHCEFCMSGHHNVCRNLRFLSQPEDPGFFRDYANLPAANLLAIPESLGTSAGTLVEPLAVVLHSMQFAQPRLGETAVVFGAGPIGLMTIAVLKLAGLARVWAIEPAPHRRELARVLGADDALDAGAIPEVLAATGRRGVDLAIDCAAQDNTANECLHVTRNAGRVVFTGIPAEIQVPLDFHPWRRKELALYQVRRSNHEAHAARDLLIAHPSRFGAMLTHERPLESVAEAFRIAHQREDGVGKMVVAL